MLTSWITIVGSNLVDMIGPERLSANCRRLWLSHWREPSVHFFKVEKSEIQIGDTPSEV